MTECGTCFLLDGDKSDDDEDEQNIYAGKHKKRAENKCVALASIVYVYYGI